MKCKPRTTTSCEDTDKEPIHCCYPGHIENELLEQLKKVNPGVNFDHKNPIVVTVTRADGTEYREIRNSCPAFEEGVIKNTCLVNNYKPQTCLGYYCSKWDKADKETLIKGRFDEKSVDYLKKHIKVLAKLSRKYFIITDKPKFLYFKLFGEPAPKMDLDNFVKFKGVYVDNEETFTDLWKLKLLQDRRVIITNTPLEKLLSEEDIEKEWTSLKDMLLQRYTYAVEINA